jgi:hypothetical protein
MDFAIRLVLEVSSSQALWLTPVIPGNWGAEIMRIVVQGQLGVLQR